MSDWVAKVMRETQTEYEKRTGKVDIGLECRAVRWHGTPSYGEEPHEWHFFRYGPNGMYLGSCTGRKGPSLDNSAVVEQDDLS